MANAFWGGFAKGLKGRLDQENDLELEMDKEKRLQDLKKKYEAEIIDSQQTQIVGNEEIRYNKYGTEISRRPLSPEEIAVRKAEVGKVTADARRSTTEADMSDYNYGNREEDRKLKLDEYESVRNAREAQTAQGWAGLDIQRERLTPKEEEEVQLVEALIYEGGDIDKDSAQALYEAFQVDLGRASTPAERKSIIARYKGQAKNRVNRTNQAVRAEYRDGGASYTEGSDGMAPPSR